MLISALAFVGVFGLMVLLHELGHFVMARRAGIKILEFGVGYPPRIATLAERGGVKYTLNAIPLGGFVRLLGEEDPSEPGSFASKSASARVATLLAGPFMNLVLAAVLFMLTSILGDQIPVAKVAVQSVAPNSPAQQAGVRAGDIILSLEGQEAYNLTVVSTQTSAYLGRELVVSLQRGQERLTLRMTPRASPPAGEGPLGVVIAMSGDITWRTIRHPVWEAVPLGLRQTWTTLVLIVSGFASMFRQGISSGEVLGPVGIFQMSGTVARTGLVNLMRFTAILSLNLIIINLLPLPAIDGGRIALVLLEKLRGGRRIAPRQEGLLHLLGFALILILMLVVSYFDVVRILTGANPLP